MVSERPKALDLFCGCGGLTTGLKQAGFKVVGGVEIDASAIETYQANHRSIKTWTVDIRDLTVGEVKDCLKLDEGVLDLLAGCPPCQGFSSIRTLNGGRQVNDPRNDLVFEFLRFVRELQPKAIMMENVPGLASDHRMEQFWNELWSLGYVGEQRVVDAADYGVPQRRRRMLLLAGRSGPVPFASASSHRRSVRQAIGSLPIPGESGDALHDLLPAKHNERVMSLISKIPKDGGGRQDLDQTHQLECHKRSNGFKDVYGRMAWGTVAPTITSGCFNPSKGRFLHPDQDRAITLREAALLQTFPPRYIFSLGRGKTHIASLIGNALPPKFIKRHALQIRLYLMNSSLETPRATVQKDNHA